MIQAIIILAVAGWVVRGAKFLRQPPVIGQMAAGFLLGPTLLGAVLPELSAVLFPVSSLALLSKVAGFIVAAYLAVIGLEFDAGVIVGRKKELLAVSAASIFVPAAVGLVVGYGLYVRLNPSLPMGAYLVFMAVCFAVTAFPVLAKIIDDKGLNGTPEGGFAMAVSAVIEVCAWAAMPVILALASTAGGSATGVLVNCGIYFVVMFVGVRLLFARLWMSVQSAYVWWPLAIATCVVSAWVTEHIGIHAIIGAFTAGMIIPREIAHKMEHVLKPRLTALLPIFFASAGLRCSLEIRAEWLGLIGLVTVTAYLSKFLGTRLVARSVGCDSHLSNVVSNLLASKGAMEIVILGIGLEAALIDANTYGIMCIMTIAVTAVVPWGHDIIAWFRTRRLASLLPQPSVPAGAEVPEE